MILFGAAGSASQRLLPAELVERHGLLKGLGQLKPSASHVCLYAGFTGDAASLGLPKTNYWLYPQFDHDLSVKRFMDSPGLDFPMIYISFPSAKDPDWDRRYPGKSTVEIVAPSFPQWKGSTWNKRGEDYEAFKARITEVLLEALYKHQPQLRGALDYCELSTPLCTVERGRRDLWHRAYGGALRTARDPPADADQGLLPDRLRRGYRRGAAVR